MAIVKQCDRCGKFYNPYPISNKPQMYNALRRVKMSDSNLTELSKSSHIDLCKECMCEFDKFMDMSDMRYAKKIDPSSTEDL